MLLPLLLLWLTSSAVNAVSVNVSNVKPLPLKTAGAVSTAQQLFQQSCPGETQPTAKVIVSSLGVDNKPHDLDKADAKLYASSDSLVRGAIDAWAQHQSLVLRPDVVWFEILSQLNLYMKKHAEELRHLFVDHEGQEEIVVKELTWHAVIDGFKSGIQKKVKTPWLEGWITPGFTTSTANDNTTATVLLMGLMQQYFTFTGGIICGLPKVQLLGCREDWAALLDKTERLKDFGAEPSQYAKNLRPILSMFVKTWDAPESESVRAFWNKIVRANKVFSCGAGPLEYDVSGWITGFLHWTAGGELRVPAGIPADADATTVDGVAYARINLNQLPVGYAKAPLKMLDYPTYGTSSMAYVLAGNLGIGRSPAASGVLAQPLSAWFLYGPVDVNATSSERDIGSRSELQLIYQGFRNSCPKGRH